MFAMIFKFILHASSDKLDPLYLVFRLSVTEYRFNINEAHAGSILKVDSEPKEKPPTNAGGVALTS